MGSIRKAPRTGRWEVRYRDAAGRQRTETYDLRADARARLAIIDTDLQRGTWRDPAFGRTPLAEWVDEWWSTTTNLRPSTRARDESYLRNHVLPRFGKAQLGHVTQLEVRAWVADLGAQGLAPATVQKAKKAYQILGKVMQTTSTASD